MNQQRTYFVYILTNWNHKVMYIGITNNLHKRIYQHKYKLIDGFTKKYNCHFLVYYEHFKNIDEEIHRNILLRKILNNIHQKYLTGKEINPIEFYEHHETRDRVLLVKKKEIENLFQKTQEKGLTFIALEVYQPDSSNKSLDNKIKYSANNIDY